MSRKTVGGDKVLQSTNNFLRCYTCNRKGHLMRNCPFSAVHGQRPFSASFEANSTGMCDELCCIGTHRPQTAPVPDKIRTGRHLILLRITMVVCTCFTDTGSEVTLINKCMKKVQFTFISSFFPYVTRSFGPLYSYAAECKFILSA